MLYHIDMICGTVTRFAIRIRIRDVDSISALSDSSPCQTDTVPIGRQFNIDPITVCPVSF